MKRFLSMLLALALVLTTLMIPVAAEDGAGEATPETPVVETVAADITSIANGDTFAAGANIILAVEVTGLENVAHIDFYANGDKLPGTIAGNKGAIVWYDATEGVYTISTKVTDTDGNVKDGNETVKIVVAPDESKVTLLWPSDATVTKTACYSATVSDYALFGTESLKMTPRGNYANYMFTWEEPFALDFNRIGYIVYMPEEIDGLTVRRGSRADYDTGHQMVNNTNFRKLDSNGAGLAIDPGYNFYFTESSNYTGAKVGDTDGDGVPDGKYGNYDHEAKYVDFVRFSTTGMDTSNEDKVIYLLGIYGIKDAAGIVVPEATAEIGNGATVDNAIGTYRINFSQPIFPDNKKIPANVTVDGTPVEGVTYKYGMDYVDLFLPELADGKTYTVTIPASTIMGYYNNGYKNDSTDTRKFVAETAFTFTTAADAKPVIAMSYPADGATVAANSAFAAKVVANGAADITSVKLYNGETEIATGTEMTDGEYWFTPAAAALTAGSATTLTVKALDANGNEVTASATYTGATAPSYAVKGMYEGATVVMQQEESRTITVVDSANANLASTTATAVSKVSFFDKDDNLLGSDGTAPYEHELKFDQAKTDVLKVKVYDIYGGVHDEFVYNYTVVDAVKNPISFTENFDDTTKDYSTDAALKALFAGNDGANVTRLNLSVEAFEDGNALRIDGDGENKSGFLQFIGTPSGHNVHYYEFDMRMSTSYSRNLSVSAAGYTSTGDILFNNKKTDLGIGTNSAIASSETAKIRLVLDYNAATALVYKNDLLWRTVPLTTLASGTQDPVVTLYVQTNASAHQVYIDNFSYATYDVRPEYAVKGIYEGATMVMSEEETRTITVVDKANEAIATAIEKVELLRDGVVVAESTTNVCALPNDLCGEFELEVKVTDIYGNTHSSKYNYRVVDGTKNSYSVELQNFENVADADLAGIIAPGGNITATAELSTTAVTAETGLAGNYISDGKALKIANSTERSTYVQLGAPLDSGRKVHYYSFDIAMNGSYSKGVYLRKNTLNNGTDQEVLIPKSAISTHSANYAKISVKMIIDYDYKEGASPVAYISLDGGETYTYKELTVIPSADVSPIVVLQGDNKGGDIYIDNYKYSGYDAPAKFGKGSGATDITFDTTPSSYNKVTFTTSYTNTTGAAVGVRYFFACYEEDGRLAHLYKPNHSNVKVKPEGFVYYYEDGAVDEKVDFHVNVAKSTNATSAKVFAYVIDDEGNIDFSPIGWY